MGGIFLDIFRGIKGLGLMGIILSIIVFGVQFLFLKKLYKNRS